MKYRNVVFLKYLSLSLSTHPLFLSHSHVFIPIMTMGYETMDPSAPHMHVNRLNFSSTTRKVSLGLQLIICFRTRILSDNFIYQARGHVFKIRIWTFHLENPLIPAYHLERLVRRCAKYYIIILCVHHTCFLFISAPNRISARMAYIWSVYYRNCFWIFYWKKTNDVYFTSSYSIFI